ncbi:MAG: hypothetical protein ABJN04_08190 [Hyphomicrobiales bacterium]
MFDDVWKFALIVAVTAALVSGYDALFNNGEWVRYAIVELDVPDFPDLFASL